MPSLRDRQHRDIRFESDIHEIRRASGLGREDVPAMPYAASPATCALLAEMALEHARAAEHPLGRQAGEDALLLIENLADSGRPDDMLIGAGAALVTGDAFLLLHEAHRAKDCFEIATSIFDKAHDRAGAARARLGLAKALLVLHDPSARALLEDAGELFEDIGDERSVLAIDVALREVQADLEESPRSFHARVR